MSVIGNPLLLSPEGYQISRSVRLRSSASAYFNRTPASAGSQTTWTWSGWVKRGDVASRNVLFSADATNEHTIRFENNCLEVFRYQAGVGYTFQVTSTAVYRDPSAWYHVVVAYDTTQATAANRVKVFVNGTQLTAFGTASYPSQNSTYSINSTGLHTLGKSAAGATYFDGYLTEINFIDGQALTPTSFGETDAVTGVWEPKKYTGTYGTNGFYLNFSDPSAATAAAIGKDYSGNGNNWTPNNISVTAGVTYDSMLDVPTMWADGGNGRGNYAVLNPLAISGGTPTEANLRVGNASNTGTRATFGATSGKFYWETTVNTLGSTYVGLIPSDTFSNGYTPGQSFGVNSSGNVWQNSTDTGLDGLPSIAANDVIGMAVDFENKLVWWAKNGQWYSGNAAAETAITASDVSSGLYGFPYSSYSGNDWVPMFSTSTTANNVSANFGQRPFAYTPPTGFKALNTQNLPEPTIVDGSQYFDATTYTGNGGALTVTNSGSMQPDLLWTKPRSSTAFHYLQDAVRGVNKALFSNATDAEYSISPTTTTLNSNGFSFNGGESGLNANTQTYIAWQWKAGGTPAVTNTAGSITSTVSAGVTQGFSVVTYTGTLSSAGTATVGHGLGVAPSLIISKSRTNVSNWVVHHPSLTNANYATFLNLTNAQADTSGNGSISAPTSSVFTTNWTNGYNEAGNNYVAYCFAEVPGFSKFGSYTGNGSADGPFVFCGFRPRYVLIKASSAAGTWTVWDSARSAANSTNLTLAPNNSNAENTVINIDFLSNGFKVRHVGDINVSGVTSIYAAFAENPFKNALAR